MCERELKFLSACAIVLSMLVACDDSMDPLISEDEQAGSCEDCEDTVTDTEAGNSGNHEDPADYIWDSSDVIQIVLNGNSVTVDAACVNVNGTKVTITSSGTYSISGSMSDGQIIVNTDDKEIVRLIMNGVNINSSASTPVYIISAEKIVIVLAEYTENYVKDGETYIFEDPEEDEPNAAIFSKSDLTICGNGSLTVDGRFNDGIAGKDGLIITNGTITVNASDDGIRGKDYLVIKNGNITVNAKGDGLKSDNADDATMGYISVKTGIINVISGGDAIVSETDITISDGEIILSSGGSSNNRVDENTSAKGIKAGVSLVIDGGTFTINSADDAIHSNRNIVINGGSFVISTGDDGMHADISLGINGGDISITKSYEGIESEVIAINNGNIHLVSSDDGINASTGGGGDFGMGGRPAQGGFVTSGNCFLYINGGYVVVNATGDGIDVNGSVVMTGGDIIVNGPTSNMNSALDHGSFKITGGFLLAVGSSGMAQAPGVSSSQYSILMNLRTTQQAGTMVHIQLNNCKEILSFTPIKKFQSVVFSSAELKKGSTYDVYFRGSSTGTVVDGLYQNGTYTPGTMFASFTISGIVTKVSN